MSPQNMNDQQILNDMLMTEKYISSSYEHSLLESSNEEIRKAFQHIQQEEQDHANQIYTAMYQRGWYPVEPAHR